MLDLIKPSLLFGRCIGIIYICLMQDILELVVWVDPAADDVYGRAYGNTFCKF